MITCCGVPLTKVVEESDWNKHVCVFCSSCADLDMIVGRGATEAEALEDYREQYANRHGEEPEGVDQ